MIEAWKGIAFFAVIVFIFCMIPVSIFVEERRMAGFMTRLEYYLFYWDVKELWRRTQKEIEVANTL